MATSGLGRMRSCRARRKTLAIRLLPHAAELNMSSSYFRSRWFVVLASLVAASCYAQQPGESASGTPPSSAPAVPENQAGAPAACPAIVVPQGTRLPLMLANGINTRTAKPGDSVYFQTVYPIAIHNRIAIPMGSFVRGELLETRRPGFLKGRAEIRMVLNQITFPTGYTVSLAATPASADRGGREGVDAEGKIVAPSGVKHDAGVILVTTAGGTYIGTLAGAAASGAAGKGALIGAGAGAAAGILAALLTRGPDAELPRGTTLDVALDRALVLDEERLPPNSPGTAPAIPVPGVHGEEPRSRNRAKGPGLWPFPHL